jgi:hypothetical protein
MTRGSGAGVVVFLVLAGGCATGGDSGASGDVLRDVPDAPATGDDSAVVPDAPEAGPDGCDPAACDARCVAAGYPDGTCRTNGTCACSGGCDDAECAERCAAAGYPAGACRETGACACSGGDAGAPSSAGERCGDEVDNNGNGVVDEGCGCEEDSTQPCYSGPPETRNVGACRDGVQECTGQGGYAHWGECEGEALPGAEECDGLDNDCDRAADEDCPGGCTPEGAVETACGDYADNDCDGVADCFDPDCPPCCSEELCDDGIDNNCDGQTDEYCDEPCVPSESPFLGNCSDGLDNDCDTRADCLDLECLAECCSPEACGDRADNDCDGRADCDDPDCCLEAACRGTETCSGVCCQAGTYRYCDTPSYCSWGRQECRPDGRWGSCAETGAPGSCGGYFYSTSCCVSLGLCCQNYGGYDPTLPWDASVGDCGDVVAACP